MSVALYMDVHVRRAVTNGLRLRGVDVITAQEDGTARWSDDRLLDRAGELGESFSVRMTISWPKPNSDSRTAVILQESFTSTNSPSPSANV